MNGKKIGMGVLIFLSASFIAGGITWYILYGMTKWVPFEIYDSNIDTSTPSAPLILGFSASTELDYWDFRYSTSSSAVTVYLMDMCNTQAYYEGYSYSYISILPDSVSYFLRLQPSDYGLTCSPDSLSVIFDVPSGSVTVDWESYNVYYESKSTSLIYYLIGGTVLLGIGFAVVGAIKPKAETVPL